jgi:hypothetical protein
MRHTFAGSLPNALFELARVKELGNDGVAVKHAAVELADGS